MPRTKAPHRCQMILDNTIKTTQWREVRSSNRARNTGKLHTKEWTWDLTCIKQKSSGCQRIWSTGWKCNLWGMDVRKMIWRISNRQTLRLISDFKADHGINIFCHQGLSVNFPLYPQSWRFWSQWFTPSASNASEKQSETFPPTELFSRT